MCHRHVHSVSSIVAIVPRCLHCPWVLLNRVWRLWCHTLVRCASHQGWAGLRDADEGLQLGLGLGCAVPIRVLSLSSPLHLIRGQLSIQLQRL